MKAHIFEEHSSVFPLWWQGRAKARTVIYLDAHLDMQFINAERIAQLERCCSTDQVHSLEKPHSLLSDKNYSYSLEDFIYPAAKLGLIDKLIWVAPPHVRSENSVHAIGQLQQMDGVRPEDLYALTKSREGWLEGKILGLDIIICDYRHLEEISIPADSLIDIDIDYFITVPGDQAWVDPGEVFNVLQRLPITPEFVTISRSVQSGFTPLQYRYIADYLAALWEGRHDEQEHYARLFDFDALLRAGRRPEAVSGLRKELEQYSGCAATWHCLGLAEVDVAEAAQCIKRASELSDAYRQNLLRSVSELQNRSLPVDLSSVLGMERRLRTEPDTDKGEQALVWAALGMTYCLFGELSRAMDCNQRASLVLGEHPDLALEIGKLLLRAGHLDHAENYLETALHGDKSRTGAHLLIAQIRRAKGRLDEARDHLLSASSAAPAWDELIELLAAVHGHMGNHAEAQDCLMRCNDQRMQAEILMRKLEHGQAANIL